MKVLVDCTPLRSGGGVQCAVALIEGLRAQTSVEWLVVIPDVLASSAPHLFTAELLADGQVKVLPKQSLWDIVRAARALKKIERQAKPDVVYTVFGPAYFRAKAPHLVGFALPNLIYQRDGTLTDSRLRTRIGDAVRQALIRRADHHVVETRTVADKMACRLSISRERISVIGNSVNSLLPQPLRKRGGDKKNIILIPSAYYKHKNLEVILPAAAVLARDYPGLATEFRFTLDPQSAAWKKLYQTAEVLGVADHVKTLGVLSLHALADAYEDSTIVLLPTLREASTAVYPEAFHFRRPLITSDLDFARELCGEAALFVPPDQPLAIAEAIATLAADQDRAGALVAAGVDRLAATYPSPERKFEMQLELLHKVSASRSMPATI